MGIDGWLIMGLIATALAAAFSDDPRHPVRARLRRFRDR